MRIGAVGHIHAFRRGRHFASWLGLTPRESSSGGRRRLDGIRIRCELRDHGEMYGVQAQFLHGDVPIYCRTFNLRLDPTRTSREMAIAWAEAERPAIG
jgi:transposase